MWRRSLPAAMTAAAALVVSLLTVAAPASATSSVAEQPAQSSLAAITGSEFDPGYIIDDTKFFDGNAMSVAEIQAFMNARVPTCARGATCLKNYVETTRTIAASPMCAQYDGAPNESAATIIYKVQRACGVSAKAILVILQKEQGLVTKTAPTAGALRAAMGAGCPDTAACDANYYGFFNQVHYGAFLLKRYTQPAGTGAGTAYPTRFDQRYPVGQVSQILYHPNAACGTGPVYVRNQATHSLYVYTPYQPNAAALASLGGTGDACSSYGNRNFWVYYNNWFGSPTNPTSPIGSFDSVSTSPGTVKVAGWAFDYDDHAAPLTIRVTIAGETSTLTANQPRADVAAAFDISNPNHGFNGSVTTTALGTQSVCVSAVNVGFGGDTLLGCRTVQLRGGTPIGVVDSVSASPGSVTVRGWAFDPDVDASIQMKVTVNGATTAVTADGSRPDVASAYQLANAAHGYAATVPIPSPGSQRVCVVAVNQGAGADLDLGCRTVSTPGGSPIGSADVISAVPGGVRVGGWALDIDTADPINVHVYVDNMAVGVLANGSRPDIAAAYSGYGAPHGFSATVPALAGRHQVCVYGINVGVGANVLIRCASVVVASGSPIGALDSAVLAPGTVTVSGWTLDYDTPDSIPVHVYVDNAGVAATASLTRSDIGSLFPGYGAAHGYRVTVPMPAGTHRVCVYGINVGAGANNALGCVTRTALGGSPIAALDRVVTQGGVITASGWAFDPDTLDPTQIVLTIDGVATTGSATASRPDVGSIYPVYGANRGYSVSAPASPGSHQVCVTVTNMGAGSDAVLGCRTVTL